MKDRNKKEDVVEYVEFVVDDGVDDPNKPVIRIPKKQLIDIRSYLKGVEDHRNAVLKEKPSEN
jgi:hypothetical protein